MAGLRELVLELTDYCPQRCLHCSSSSGPARRGHLDAQLVEALVREAAMLGAQKVSFGGGEPMCSPLILDALRHVESLGLVAEVFTAGVFQSAQRLVSWPDQLISALRDLRFLKLIFSVHGPNVEVHEGITRVPGSFDAMLGSLEACLAAGIHCEMNFVPLSLNASSFSRVVALAAEFGVGRLSVLRFVPQGRGYSNCTGLVLSASEEDLFVEQLLRLRESAPVEIRTGSPFNGIVPGNSTPCRAGTEKLVVQADGNVLPCEVFKHRCARAWGLSVYALSLSEILGSAQLADLRYILGRDDCLVCPVHSMLRARQEEAADVTADTQEAALHV